MDNRTQYYDNGSFSALIYDAIETALRPTAQEIAFYIELARGVSTPVLYPGVGSGRIAWPMAEAGIAVVGVDLADDLLRQARAKAADRPNAAPVELRRGDMRRLDVLGDVLDGVPGPYDLAIAPHRVFNHLLTETDQRRFLTGLAARLTPGGRAALDVFHPAAADFQDGVFIERPFPGLLTETARVEIDVVERQFDMERRITTMAFRYRVTSVADGRVAHETVETLAYRWTPPPEMRRLFADCGFRVLEEWADVFRRPAADGDRVWIVEKT